MGVKFSDPHCTAAVVLSASAAGPCISGFLR